MSAQDEEFYVLVTEERKRLVKDIAVSAQIIARALSLALDNEYESEQTDHDQDTEE